MIRFAVIGTGWIAEEFVKGAQLVPGLKFAAVYSRSAGYFDESCEKSKCALVILPISFNAEESASLSGKCKYIIASEYIKSFLWASSQSSEYSSGSTHTGFSHSTCLPL